MATNIDDFLGKKTGDKPSVSESSIDSFLGAPKQNRTLVQDLGTDVKRGVQQLPGAVTGLLDIPVAAVTGERYVSKAADALGEATGFQPGKWAEEARQEYSQGRQFGSADIDKAWEEGGASKIAGAYLRNPGNIAGLVAESLPSMVAGGLAGRAALTAGRAAGAVAVPTTAAQAARQGLIAGAGGEGAVIAGQSMDQIDDSVDARRAAAAATGAGVIGAAFGYGGGRLAERMGVIDPETVFAGGRAAVTGAADAPPPGLVGRMLGGAMTEGVFEELPQSVQEAMWQNWAEGKPLFEGVPRAAVEGVLAGGVMGAGANVLSAPRSRTDDVSPPVAEESGPAGLLPAPTNTGTPDEQILQSESARANAVAEAEARAADLYRRRDEVDAQRQAPDVPPSVRMGLDPNAGPLSAAAAAAVDNGVGPVPPATDTGAQAAAVSVDALATDAQQSAHAPGLIDQSADPNAQPIDRPVIDRAPPTADQFDFGEFAPLVPNQSPIPLENAQRLVDLLRNQGADFAVVPATDGQGFGFGPIESLTLAQREAVSPFQPATPAGSVPVQSRDPAPGVSASSAVARADTASDRQPDRSVQQATPSLDAQAEADATPAADVQIVRMSPPAKSAEAAERIAVRNRERTGLDWRVMPHPRMEDRYVAALVAPPEQPQPLANGGDQAPAPRQAEASAVAVAPEPVTETTQQAAPRRMVPMTEVGARRTAERWTQERGTPYEAVPHPKVAGRFAVVLASQASAGVSAASSADSSDVAGPQINRAWTAFAPRSGTLSIPRAEMPQIRAEHRGAMVQFMNARGVEHQQETVSAGDLKPTQAEFSPAKVRQAKGFAGGDRSILISSDGFVLDGHHQWLAKRENGEAIKVIRLNAPIRNLIALAHEFPSSTTAKGARLDVGTQTGGKRDGSGAIDTTNAAVAAPGDAKASPDVGGSSGDTLLRRDVPSMGGMEPAAAPPVASERQVESAGDASDGRAAVAPGDGSPAGQALRILIERTDGNGSPDGLAGPENADARTAIVAAITGQSVAEIEAAPNYKFRTSVPQVERLLYDAAGIPAGNLKDRRAPFLDWLDAQTGQQAPQAESWADGAASDVAETDAIVDVLSQDEAAAVAQRLGKRPVAGVRSAYDLIKTEHPDDIRRAIAGDQWDGRQWISAREGQGPQFSRAGQNADEFVQAPDGSIDFGEITAEMASTMRRQAGKIRLERGDDSYGERHIELRHGADIRGVGFNSVAAFVADAVRKINAVWKPSKTSQLVVVEAEERGKVVFIELKPSDNGDYYTVNSAFPTPRSYAEKKGRKEGWVKLWDRMALQPSAPAAQSPSAEQLSGDAGESAAPPSGQSSDTVAQPASDTIKSDKPANSLAARVDDDTGFTEPFSEEGDQGPQFSRAGGRGAAVLDAQYLSAVENGDMETAQRLVNEAAAQSGYQGDSDYRMSHSAPNSQDGFSASLVDVRASGMVPNDYWTHPQFYQSDPREREAFGEWSRLLRQMDARASAGKDPGAAGMTVYRAVPKSTRESHIRNGDWVTPSRAYAQDEGAAIPGGFRIIGQVVSARNLWWDGNSAAEIGYDDGKSYAYKDTKNNRKLLDPVTRDDDGNVIPLSKRFSERKDDVRFSRGSAFTPDAYDAKQYAAAVDRIAAAETAPRTDLTVGDTPAVLRALGAKALPIQMPSGMIHKASRQAIRGHDVPSTVLRNLPALLADPVMVFDSRTEQGALVALVDARDESNRPVVVAVHLDAKGGGFHSINRIASIYGKDSIADIERWMRGDLRYYRTQKASGWLRAVGLQLPEANTIKRLNPRVITEAYVVNLRFSFAGAGAQTADKYALASARQRITAGESAESVRQETGWHRGADGRWRFEISDDKAAVALTGKTFAEIHGNAYMRAAADGRQQVMVGDVLQHDALFAAYPQLRDIPLELVPDQSKAAARFLRRRGQAVVQVAPGVQRDRVASALLHELQHAIQVREGFAIGGSAQPGVENLQAAGRGVYRRLAGEVEARNTQARMQMTPAQRAMIGPDLTADTDAADVIVTFNGRDIANAVPPADVQPSSQRVRITPASLTRAFEVQFPRLAPAVRAMLERGMRGEKGGVVLIDSTSTEQIAKTFASKTGRQFDRAVELLQSDAGAPQGFFDPKSGLTFLVSPQLDLVTAPAVLLHEMVHGQQRQRIDARALSMIESRVKAPASERAFLERVAQRMADAGESGNAREATAYIVEEAVLRGRAAGFTAADSRLANWIDANIGKRVGNFVRSFIMVVRGWMVRHGVQMGPITVDDLVSYAMAGIERSARGEVRASDGRVSASISDAEVLALVEQYASVEGSPNEMQIRAAARQFRDTERAYGGREAYDRAKAAGRTKLNYRQWVQVRTPAFKRWFGDWEAASNLRWLDAGEPVASMRQDELDIDRPIKALVSDVVSRWKRETGDGVYRPELGLIAVDTRSANASIGHGANATKKRALLLVPKALAASRYLGRMQAIPNKPDAFVFAAPVAIDGQSYRMLMEVRKDENATRLYVHEVVLRKENTDPAFDYAAASQKGAEPRAAKIGALRSFMQGLRGVNPETVSKVTDPETGEPRVVYHGSPYDFAEFSVDKRGLRTGAASAKKGFFFSSDADVATTYALASREVIALKEQISELAAQYARLLTPRGFPIPEFRSQADALTAEKRAAEERLVDARRRFEGREPSQEAMDEKVLGNLGPTYPEFLSIKNPLFHDFGGLGYRDRRYSELVSDAITAGNDGVILENTRDSANSFGDTKNKDSDIYIAFRPNQIKSATSNIGTFSESDNIQFSRPGRSSPDQIARNIGEGLKAITRTNVKELGRHKLTDWLKVGLQFLGRRQLVDIYGDTLPMAEYNRLAAQMEADKNEVGATADELARRWGKLPDEAKLADLMHDATLAQIDADDGVPYAEGDKKVMSTLLKNRFKALTPEAQQVYRDARDHYKAHHEQVRQAIIDRIMRSELRSEKRAEIIRRMDGEFFKSIKGVYFPLARFGQYVVAVRDGSGKVTSVSRAETMAEASAMRQEMLKAFPAADGYRVGRVTLGKEFIAGRDMVGRGFMTELYETLDKQEMNTEQRLELEDTLGQLYLSSLPDLSWAKHGIHRKGTPGFSQDARRAFAQNTFHGARYLAKLKYGDQMQTELDRMQKHADEMNNVEGFDQPAAQRVVDEMNKRHDAMMNPKSNPISTALTSVGFVYYLGLSPAAAVVNMSQTPLVAYPIMGAKWGWAKAASALMGASAQAARGKNDIRTQLTDADEIRAYDEAVRSGTIDVTMAHDLAGIAQGEDAKVMWKMRPVMRLASYLFHHAERFNRQATFIAAYRLARGTGVDHKTAVEQATDATYKGHFDYSAGNRPRVMQGNVARVVLLFKQFAQNMIFTVSRNAYQSVKGESPEVRREARKVFAALMATHAAAAGVLGLPVVGVLMTVASALGGSDDEPWDAELALRNMLADAFGPKASEVMAKGVSRLTPWDISGRVGLDKLLLPDVQEGLEGQRWAESFSTAMLGPVIGMGVNAAKGAQKMADGDYGRGLEDMLPIFARNPIKAYRYWDEGAQDRTGITIKDEVGVAGALGQAAGFSPSEVRLAFEGRSAVMNADRRLRERRQDLMGQYARAAMDQDQDGMAKAREAIRGFNERNPTRRIAPLHLSQSIRARRRRIEQAEDGIYLPRNRRDVLDAGEFAFSG